MTEPRFAFHKDAVLAGWFSRRHETGDAHREARETWRTDRGKEARKRRADARASCRSLAGALPNPGLSTVGCGLTAALPKETQ